MKLGIVLTVFLGLFIVANSVADQRDAQAQPVDSERSGPVACEAVVQKYLGGAMWDHFEGGGFTGFDAVVFKVVSPAAKAGQEIRVYVEARSVVDDSSLRKTGAPYRFEFDFALLKHDPLFLGALKNLERMGTGGTDAPKK